MGEFITRPTRVGPVHGYPDNPRAAALALFARNFASGPGTDTAVTTAGTLVPWSAIDSGAPAGTDVPITPRSTGVVRISGVLSLSCISEGNEWVQLLVQVGGVAQAIPAVEKDTVSAGGFTAVPFLAEVTLPIGVAANIQIKLNPRVNDTVTIVADSCTIEVQEVPVATG